MMRLVGAKGVAVVSGRAKRSEEGAKDCALPVAAGLSPSYTLEVVPNPTIVFAEAAKWLSKTAFLHSHAVHRLPIVAACPVKNSCSFVLHTQPAQFVSTRAAPLCACAAVSHRRAPSLISPPAAACLLSSTTPAATSLATSSPSPSHPRTRLPAVSPPAANMGDLANRKVFKVR